MRQVLVAGEARGVTLRLTEPLSFWGGVREHDGVIIDVHHPQHGTCITGRVLVMPGGRGSSSSSSVLAELVRGRVAPAAILLANPDPILAVGALVAESLYQVVVPMVVLPPDEYARIPDAVPARVDAEGVLHLD